MKKFNSINRIKKRFYYNNFCWSDVMELPGPFVRNYVIDNKIEITTIYSWLNEYIISKSFMNDCFYNISKIFEIYNCGLSKESILTIYDSVMCGYYDEKNLDLIIHCLFQFTNHQINNDFFMSGLLYYLRLYKLDDQFNLACKKFEETFKKIDIEFEKNLYIDKHKIFITDFNNEKFINEIYSEADAFAIKQIKKLNWLFNRYIDFKRSSNDEKYFSKIEKSIELLQLIYQFDYKKLNADIESGTCNIYINE